ncbi:Porin [Pseudomonas jessenii]
MDSPRQAGTPIFQLAQSLAPICVLRVERALVDDQTWAHGGAQGNALDVNAFRGSWLDTLQISDQGFNVFLQLDGVEADLANGSVDDAVFVGAITNLTSFGVFNRGSYVWSYGADFRVRHQATWTEDLTQLTYNAHCIRGCDHYVIVQVAAFHFGSQIVHAYAVSAGSQSGFSSWTLGEHSNANGLASAVWQHSSATNDLVGFTRVNTQVYSYVERLAELDSRQLGQQGSSVYKVVGLACFDFAGDSLLTLGQLSHYTPSTLRPMLRAEPAMVRTAASISAAVRSAFLVFAISSS